MLIRTNPTPVEGRPISSLNFYLGLFVTTACTLMLQLVQTRILSVVTWYHLAFFAISMAMFGMTAGAVWVYLRRDRFSQKTFSHDVAYFGTAFAATTALCLAVQMTISPVVFRTASGILTWVELSLLLSVPFFFSGIVVSLALTRSPFPIGRVYGVDMVGAAVGCLGVLAVLNSTDGPSAVLLVAALSAGGAWLFARSGIGGAPTPTPPLTAVLGRPGSVCLVLALLALANSRVDSGLQPLVVKGTFEGGGALYTQWNSFSRVAVLPVVNESPAMWGPSPRLSLDEIRIDQRRLNIDGDAGTVAYRFQNVDELGFLRFDVTNLAYYLPGQERVAVIGVGAGRDMLSAWLFGVRDITGVEINPVFVRLLTAEGGLGDFTPVSRLEGMRFVVDDGRSWFARSQDSFDVIQMSMVDTWAATGAGAFTLSENGLYTIEAWNIFLDR